MTVVSPTASSQFLVHGSPNWVDLETSNVDRSRTFYRDLFGWSFRDRFSIPARPDGRTVDQESAQASSIAVLGGKPSAELHDRNDSFNDMKLPAKWEPFVHVIDLKSTLRRVELAGGQVLSGPTDRGSMAVVATIADPFDAVLSLWQPRDSPGSANLHSVGSLTWLDLETPDVEGAARFYRAVFDWTATEQPMGMRADGSFDSYTVFATSLGPVAGVVRSTVQGIPASWCPSFSVIDTDIMAHTATRYGAVVMSEPYDLPVGRQAVIVDPEGAVFSLLGPVRHIKRCRLSTLV